MSREPSIFTKIINREIPSKIIFEDEEFIVINDIQPRAPIPFLVVPKKQPTTLEEVDQTDLDFHARLLLTARKVAKQLGIADNYKLFMNVGTKVQQVHHIHLHVLGGWDESLTQDDLQKVSKEIGSL